MSSPGMFETNPPSRFRDALFGSHLKGIDDSLQIQEYFCTFKNVTFQSDTGDCLAFIFVMHQFFHKLWKNCLLQKLQNLHNTIKWIQCWNKKTSIIAQFWNQLFITAMFCCPWRHLFCLDGTNKFGIFCSLICCKGSIEPNTRNVLGYVKYAIIIYDYFIFVYVALV